MSKFTLTIETDNAAFADQSEEVARVLREAAGTVESGRRNWPIRDVNGNTVGHFEFTSDDDTEGGGVMSGTRYSADEAVEFFYEWAGWSYDPATETSEDGRRRTARELASAEAWANAHGLNFQWWVDDDPIWDDDVDRETTDYDQYVCVAGYRDAGSFDTLNVKTSLGSIDFGPGMDYTHSSYARVVEAELALEVRDGGGQ